MTEFSTLRGSWPWPRIGSHCIPSCITHRPLPTHQISLKSKKLFVDGRTFETHFIRPSRPNNNNNNYQLMFSLHTCTIYTAATNRVPVKTDTQVNHDILFQCLSFTFLPVFQSRHRQMTSEGCQEIWLTTAVQPALCPAPRTTNTNQVISSSVGCTSCPAPRTTNTNNGCPMPSLKPHTCSENLWQTSFSFIISAWSCFGADIFKFPAPT